MMQNRNFVFSLLKAASVLALVGLHANPVLADPITFAPAEYDNTANVVNAGPTPVNNQTTGLFRDSIWWSINNGNPRVGSPDFINSGNSLILSANHAVPGSGPYTALNFTGPAISGGQSYISLYDTTPADGTTTKNVFSATGGLQISADVLFVKHNASAGLVALYNEGQDALALLANNRDGNNTDMPSIRLVWQSTGAGIVLANVTLPALSFDDAVWYRIIMDVTVTGNTWTVNGTFQNHVTGTDPNSALGSVITLLTYSGLLSNPSPGSTLDGARVLSNPGEVGIIAMGNESISLPDNVGVSVTNFQIPTTAVPEPASMILLGTGLVGLGRFYRRKKR